MSLSSLIAEANMTQAALARSSKVDLSTINYLANGHRLPTLATARAICEALSFELGRPLSVDDVFPPITETPIDGESHD